MLDIFHKEGEIIEIRVIGKTTASGYFNNTNKAMEWAMKNDGKANIYFVLNKINSACYHRENRDKLIDKAQNTSDSDIEQRRWIFIDFDPKRAAKTSSTDEEKEKAKKTMQKTAKYLQGRGFKSPVIADSGNGWHLLYKIDMPNDAESKKLIENFLKALSLMFSNDDTDIDTAVFNAGRITKLYGTVSVKGANTPERPHRRSEITYIPKTIEVTPINKIKEIADILPKPTAKNYQTDFDLQEFINKHGIRVAKIKHDNGATKYILEDCPFDSGHGKDSAIIQLNNGALIFTCFHNSCQGNTWREFRKLYEPNFEAEREEKNKGYQNTKRDFKTKPDVNLEPTVPSQLDNKTLALLNKAKNLKDIKALDRSNLEIFSTGIDSLDSQVEIVFGKLIIVTGVNGCGKSTILGQTMLEALEQGYNVFTYSGELKQDEFQYWIDLQSAGSDHVVKEVSKKGKEYYKIKNQAKKDIHNWYDNRFFLYDNDESMKYQDILEVIEAYRVHRKCRVIFLDNFLTLDISDLDYKDLEAQTKFIWSLSKYCKKNNVLIFLVIHPKKIFEGICTKQDVLGSGNFSNAIDYMLIVHRTTEHFKTHLQKRRINKDIKEALESASNVIEIGKDRWSGKEGLNIPLLYCEDNKRIIDYYNQSSKYKKYGWEKKTGFNASDTDGFIEVDVQDNPF